MLAPQVLVDEVGIHRFVTEEARVILGQRPEARGQVALNAMTLTNVTVYLQVVFLLATDQAMVGAGALPQFGYIYVMYLIGLHHFIAYP